MPFTDTLLSSFRNLPIPSFVRIFRVTYGLGDYNFYRKDRDVGAVEELGELDESEDFDWVLEPPEKVAMMDYASWNEEDKPHRWAPWNEP